MIEISDYIKDLYSKLEAKSDLEELEIEWMHDDSLTEQERAIVQKEYWLLSNYALNSEDVNGKDEIIQYGRNRRENTSNIYLLARYNHVLYNLTKNTIYCKDAIENYTTVLKQYITSDNKNGYDVHIVLDWIIKLSKKVKLNMSAMEELILAYLKSNDIADKTKHWILASLKDNYAKWKLKSLDFVPHLCLDIYSCENNYERCKSILEIGAFFATRFNIQVLPVLYEKLGDNEEKTVYNYDDQLENIVKPHYNQYTYQRMMQYYQKAGNDEKLRYATAMYNENKVGMKFLKFEEKKALPQEVIDFLKKLFKWADESKPESVLRFLSEHNGLFISHSRLDEMWKEKEKNKPFYMEHMRAVRSDLNNNVRQVTHEEIYKFQLYTISLSNAIKWITHILSSLIEKKKLSFSVIKNILSRHSDFGTELVVDRNGQRFTYCWFSKIDLAIKDFFIQYQKELKDKPSDWRNVINTLTIQFEGILRESIRLYNGETSKIAGCNKENIIEMLLDDLLRTEACKELFSNEDKDLFYYTFTNKGYNIRNDVAHGFYLPYDYTSYKAILVFLCLLRLVHYNNSK